jgi:hypothetical protein
MLKMLLASLAMAVAVAGGAVAQPMTVLHAISPENSSRPASSTATAMSARRRAIRSSGNTRSMA